MAPRLEGFDHVHVFVRDRAAAEHWYADVMHLTRVVRLAFWARDGGPLTISNDSGTVRLALFEAPPRPCRSTIAFAVDAGNFLAWRRHLESALDQPPRLEDHEVTWSLYFSDPDGNPFEITSDQYSVLADELNERR